MNTSTQPFLNASKAEIDKIAAPYRRARKDTFDQLARILNFDVRTLPRATKDPEYGLPLPENFHDVHLFLKNNETGQGTDIRVSNAGEPFPFFPCSTEPSQTRRFGEPLARIDIVITHTGTPGPYDVVKHTLELTRKATQWDVTIKQDCMSRYDDFYHAPPLAALLSDNGLARVLTEWMKTNAGPFARKGQTVAAMLTPTAPQQTTVPAGSRNPNCRP